ncbi:Ca(2+)-dependent cysteine protease [Allomyces arbusculus]|nr:Ca(2+)-dependent cysteine protease [Allomyces arbusculus]
MSQLQNFRAKLIDAVGQFAAVVADSAKEDIVLSDEDRLLEVRPVPFSSTRTKKAVLVGCTYETCPEPEMLSKLAGPGNDAIRLQKLLRDVYGFEDENMRLLTDDGRSDTEPTANNIRNALKWLVKGAKAGDSLFFSFSGHGSGVEDTDGDELDGRDEALWACDANYINDDELHRLLVKSLPKGVRLTVLFDCCESGTALDLPFIYSIDGEILDPAHEHLQDGIVKLREASASFEEGSADANETLQEIVKGLEYLLGPAGDAELAAKKTAKKRAAADVLCLSGCRDMQTSKDVMIDGVSAGALTDAFIKAVAPPGFVDAGVELAEYEDDEEQDAEEEEEEEEEDEEEEDDYEPDEEEEEEVTYKSKSKNGAPKSEGPLTYVQLLHRLRANLEDTYMQQPQLSASRPLNLASAEFCM